MMGMMGMPMNQMGMMGMHGLGMPMPGTPALLHARHATPVLRQALQRHATVRCWSIAIKWDDRGVPCDWAELAGSLVCR
jgi:hypothetical protein